MTNIPEHPLTIDLQKRIAASKSADGTIPILAFVPGAGKLQGALRLGDTPGVFVLACNTQIEGTNQQGIMDYSLTVDKVAFFIHPNLEAKKEESRIVQ
jgi:hypothetical protein